MSERLGFTDEEILEADRRREREIAADELMGEDEKDAYEDPRFNPFIPDEGKGE